jgi:hypothetical protein
VRAVNFAHPARTKRARDDECAEACAFCERQRKDPVFSRDGSYRRAEQNARRAAALCDRRFRGSAE